VRVNVEEKLAAILVAEVAEYADLAAHDRAGAEAALQLCHHEVIDAAIAVYGGRIFELAPERTLAEFTSPLAAVRCAVEIQGGLARRMAEVPAAKRIRLRIGIHYGMALVEQGELTGEALTIARRVQAVADAGEICVSRTVVEAVRRGSGTASRTSRGWAGRCRRRAWRSASSQRRTLPATHRRGSAAWAVWC
jgi:class 3 adenylate cyclase